VHSLLPIAASYVSPDRESLAASVARASAKSPRTGLRLAIILSAADGRGPEPETAAASASDLEATADRLEQEEIAQTIASAVIQAAKPFCD
jgi:hypothetical protein